MARADLCIPSMRQYSLNLYIVVELRGVGDSQSLLGYSRLASMPADFLSKSTPKP